ncbi:MAG: PaaI family thioesterase [Desulfovermiculus sp.]
MYPADNIDPEIKTAIYQAVDKEPLAQSFHMRLVDLELGYSKVEMDYDPGSMANMYNRAHGGAVFALIDEAFETASQTRGTIAVALNVNVTYVSSPASTTTLTAEAREISCTRKTATFEIKVTDINHNIVAACQAVVYRTGKPISLGQ